jgi:lipopolysaccharide transport system ATP-binding protein
MYKIYPRRLDVALDATGLIHLFPWRKAKGREFWALRNINLVIGKGERLGIIGRNGAGKSTLLKLLTGNLAPTEGQINVNGTVQALLTSGGGFHPEFTGYENIRSSLVYQGLEPEQIENAVKEIAEFTELGDFLNQPFKLYSAGMQARLSFATATVLNPDILIVDEILGAGDAYFFGKSIERMKSLVMSGATVLIVSHAMDQISRFCEKAIWVDRGKIVHQGSSLDTIAAYEEYIHKLGDRRLQARNRKRLTGEHSAFALNEQNDNLTVRFCMKDPPTKNGLEISTVDLYEGNLVYESLRVGDTQDSDASQMIYAVLDASSGWSNPMMEGLHNFRRLQVEGTTGEVKCQLYLGNSNEQFSCEIAYRADATGLVEFWRKGELITTQLLPVRQQWDIQKIDLGLLLQPTGAERENVDTENKRKARRWPSEGSILIEEVHLLDAEDNHKALFRVGSQMKVKIILRAQKSEQFTIRPAITIMRADGVPITNLISKELFAVDLKSGQRFGFKFDFGELNLGNGNYIISPSIFRDKILYEYRYDLVAQSQEFEVIDNPRELDSYVFVHPGNWSLFL